MSEVERGDCKCGFSGDLDDWIFRSDLEAACWDPYCQHAGYECPECGRIYEQVWWGLHHEPSALKGEA